MNKHEVFIGCNLTPEQYKRNIEHYKEIKNKVCITGGGSGYGHNNYIGTASTDLTADEVALVCDEGNLCFGYSGYVKQDGSFYINIYTD